MQSCSVTQDEGLCLQRGVGGVRGQGWRWLGEGSWRPCHYSLTYGHQHPSCDHYSSHMRLVAHKKSGQFMEA
jgi:hypothetical protein